MSESPLDIRISADASAALSAIAEVQRDLSLCVIHRALAIAWHNNMVPVRIVLGHRFARRLGWHPLFGPIARVWDVPVAVDEETPWGFGLVTRPPSP